MYKKITLRHHYSSLILQVLLLLVFGLTFVVKADEISAWASVHTYHIDRTDSETVEDNNIFLIMYNDLFIGTFTNSYDKRSEVIGYHFWQRRWQNNQHEFRFSLSVAGATGYGRRLASNIDGVVTIGLSSSVGWHYAINSKHGIGIVGVYLPTDDGGVFVNGINLSVRF